MEFTDPWMEGEREGGYRNTERTEGACTQSKDGWRKKTATKPEMRSFSHCFIEHRGPSPQAANQIRGLGDGQPMESRDLVTGISCSPKVWVTWGGACGLSPAM